MPLPVHPSWMLCLVLALTALPAVGQVTTATSNPVGAVSLGAYDSSGNYLSLLGSSDTLVGLPMTRPPEFSGTILSTSSNVVTVTGTPAWTTNQFVYVALTQTKTYYALIGSGNGATNPNEGRLYMITANSANSLTVNLDGDSLASVPANAQVTIIPSWTLATVFPPANANVSFTPTTDTHSYQTLILIPDDTSAGINRATSATYYFYNNAWRLFGGDSTVDQGDDPLTPEGYFIVRNSAGTPTLPLVLTGSVLTGKLSTPLMTLAAAAQDNDVAMVRPVPVSLANTGLNNSDGSFVTTTDTHNYQDLLFVYNNDVVSFNKSSSATYYNVGASGSDSGWRLFGGTGGDAGGNSIRAGDAMVIRKAASGTGNPAYWANAPQY